MLTVDEAVEEGVDGTVTLLEIETDVGVVGEVVAITSILRAGS